ncbi:MAG: universal stress protein [Lysobacteraceae bacterium]|nr:MAG: universal stress protein [Xanthomonadaceae bacterium]
MNDSTSVLPTPLPPQRLLLATDLCAGCDRPLDRAKQLAREWQAELAVLTVRDGPQTPEEVASWLDGSPTVHAFELAARRELAEEFSGTGVTPTLQVLEGDVTDSILAAASGMPDAMVILGASRDESFQELILGSTAERLSQDLPQPLLVVRQRTRGGYQRIVVANDFSGAARRALGTALRLFPGRRITLLHVLEGASGALTATLSSAVEDAMERSAGFLDNCALSPGERALLDLAVTQGRVAEAVARYAFENTVQLVVLGVHRHSSVARVFMGSRSDDLLQHLGCDTLLVREEGSGDG